MKQQLIFLVLPLLILSGCSGSQAVNNDLKLEIISKQMDSWVNLMPGSRPSFYISGSIKIKNNENVAIDSVRMLRCNVIQDGKILYEFHPDFSSIGNALGPILPGKDRTFTLHIPPGTPIKKELNFEKAVSFNLYLAALNGIKQYKIDSINVVKVY
jgi:hypothetical protein